MRLTDNNPKNQGWIDATVSEINRNGFELVESKSFPGHYFKTRCKKCGHELKVNQHMWRFRHSMKCEG